MDDKSFLLGHYGTEAFSPNPEKKIKDNLNEIKH